MAVELSIGYYFLKYIWQIIFWNEFSSIFEKQRIFTNDNSGGRHILDSGIRPVEMAELPYQARRKNWGAQPGKIESGGNWKDIRGIQFEVRRDRFSELQS